MQSTKSSLGLMGTVSMAVVTVLLAVAHASAQTEKVVHTFNNNGVDGASPIAGLAFDNAGNLYGTTFAGGATDFGTLVELVPRTGGGWNERVIHSFSTTGGDGYDPEGGLILDQAGNLYGTTHYGGLYGGGTVFEFVRQTSGGFRERILHSFGNGKDGVFPGSSLTFDAQGNIYGTAFSGGLNALGMVFELSPKTSGGWSEKGLYNFSKNDGTGGGSPAGGVIFDSAGNLYGTTSGLGAGSDGGVFELTPTVSGPWTLTALQTFVYQGANGAQPYGGVVIDGSGNLYGTTSRGGARDLGVVFEFTPTSGGTWTETVLHSFTGGSDGCYPQYGSLVKDAVGNLYGTTFECGNTGGGVVFEVSPTGGSWTETVLYAFVSHTNDGVGPEGGLVLDASGNLFGTTQYGGAHSVGIVFEVTP